MIHIRLSYSSRLPTYYHENKSVTGEELSKKFKTTPSLEQQSLEPAMYVKATWMRVFIVESNM